MKSGYGHSSHMPAGGHAVAISGLPTGIHFLVESALDSVLLWVSLGILRAGTHFQMESTPAEPNLREFSWVPCHRDGVSHVDHAHDRDKSTEGERHE